MFEKCLKLYQKGEHSARKISKIINEYRPNVVAVLRYYDSIGEIKYNEQTIEEERKTRAAKGIHKHHIKSIVCLNDLKVYETYADAQKETGYNRITISKCCKYINHYTLTKSEEKLFWLFKEEYDKTSKEDIDKIMNFTQYYYIKDYNREKRNLKHGQ